MVHDALENARGAPLIVTAELPGDVFAWADGLRRAHFPPERNQLRAHVTLFHALPSWLEAEARDVLAGITAAAPPPDAMLSRVMDLGRGTAIAIDCPAMLEFRDLIADRFHGMLTAQDSHRIRLHVTVQNKVSPQAAKALHRDLARDFTPRSFRFHGLGLHAYEGGPWRHIGAYPFHGRR